MKRIESHEDEMRGTVTYELPDGRFTRLDARLVKEHGLTAIMRANGIEPPTERLPVIHHGQNVGTMAPDFDPASVRTTSFWYDPRPGDFRREGDTWVAARTLGPGDLDCVQGFVRADSDKR